MGFSLIMILSSFFISSLYFSKLSTDLCFPMIKPFTSFISILSPTLRRLDIVAELTPKPEDTSFKVPEKNCFVAGSYADI